MAAASVVLLTGWTAADAVISIVLSLLILVGAWRLVRESTDVLLEAVPGHIALNEVERRMLAVPGVAAVHDLRVWTVTSGMVTMSGHAIVPDLACHPLVLEGLRQVLAGVGIGHVTVQLETSDGCLEPAAPLAQARGGHHPHQPPDHLPLACWNGAACGPHLALAGPTALVYICRAETG